MKKKVKTKEQVLKSMLPYCPNCDCSWDYKAEAVDASFCPDCGTELVKPVLCLICDQPVNASNRFCPTCGVGVTRR